MHAFKDSMWRGIWKILQNFLETKQGLVLQLLKTTQDLGIRLPKQYFADDQA